MNCSWPRRKQRPSTKPDLVEIVLAALKDADLEVLQEASELNAYNAEEISSMMGERWPRYQEAVTHFHECYAQLAKASESERKRA